MKPVSTPLALFFAFALCSTFAHPQSTTATAPAPASPQAVINSMASLLSGASPTLRTSADQSSALAAMQSVVPVPADAPQTSAPAGDATADADDNPGGSDVRIVRLSQTDGSVSMDRNIGKGFEIAFPNLPVIEGAKLQTAGGVAEVELEDGSTLRLTPNSLVEFTRLQRDAAGATLSTVTVQRGTVYVDLEKTKGNTFTLVSRDGSSTLPPGAEVRFSVGLPRASFAVLKGDAVFSASSGTSVSLGKNKELFLDPQHIATQEVVVRAEEDAYDEWNRNEADFHKQYSRGSALAGSPYSYGLVDLNYYGAFADLPGCGRVWRPYFVSAAWDPYANGLWAWYPDSGFTWVSVYPWGWAPFHYGAWEQCSAGVWGWAPGGYWNGLRFRSVGGVHHGPWRPLPGGPVRHPFPPRPPHPVGGRTLLALNARPLTVSGFNPLTRSFVIRNDSAGLGIPRDTFGKLNKTAVGVEQHGSTSIAMLPGYGRTGEGLHGAGASWRPATGPGSSGGRSGGYSGGGGGHTSSGSSGSSASHSSGGGSSSGGGGASHASSGGGFSGGASGGSAHH